MGMIHDKVLIGCRREIRIWGRVDARAIRQMALPDFHPLSSRPEPRKDQSHRRSWYTESRRPLCNIRSLFSLPTFELGYSDGSAAAATNSPSCISHQMRTWNLHQSTTGRRAERRSRLAQMDPCSTPGDCSTIYMAPSSMDICSPVRCLIQYTYIDQSHIQYTKRIRVVTQVSLRSLETGL